MSSSNLRDRLREATTREILEAAESVLAEQGVVATGMASIAQRAGVSVGTLYNYFKDKDQLLATILSVRRAEFSLHLDEVAREYTSASYAAHLEAFVRTVFRLFDQYHKFLRIVIEHTGHDKTRKAWLVERMTPIVEKGVAEGRLAASGRVIYPALFAGAVSGVLSEHLDRTSAAPVGETDTVVAFILNQT